MNPGTLVFATYSDRPESSEILEKLKSHEGISTDFIKLPIDTEKIIQKINEIPETVQLLDPLNKNGVNFKPGWSI